MTTATASIPSTTTIEPRPSLEALVDRLVESVFGSTDDEPGQSLARSVHDARRLRQAGDLDRALALLAGVDTACAEPHQARWVYAEWLDLARRRFHDSGALVHSPGTGRAAVPRAPRRRLDAGGAGGPRDALASRQARLAAQPAGAPAPGGRLRVTAAASTAPVDLAALKRCHLLAEVVGDDGRRASWQGACPPGRLPLPRGARGQLHGVRRHGALVLLRLRRGRRRAGLPPAPRGPEPARGDPAARCRATDRCGQRVARLRVGANEEAIEDFSASLEIVPDDTRALFARAVARQWVGRDDAANEDFDRHFEFATDEADADPAGDARAGTPTRLGKNASLVGPTSSRW